MAKSVMIVSDLSGEPDAKTRLIIVGSDTYEIDLTDAEFEEYAKVIERYVQAGRKVARRGAHFSAPAAKPSRRSAAETKAIKQWGEEHGYTVPQRGRLPQALLDAYRVANDEI